MIFTIFSFRSGMTNERRELLRILNERNFELAYDLSKNILIDNPVDYQTLKINGISAFELGISQINHQAMLEYIDECIFSLRKALLHNSKDAGIYYVLGKAYGYKGPKYADLVVKYLEKALYLHYDAGDIPEYLGLAYAAYGDYRSSVTAFSQAFVHGIIPSDNLLLPIARSYMEMNEYNTAISYLQLCIENSPDSVSVVTARFMLAEIFKDLNDFEKAALQLLTIIDDTGENAEARFQLGEVFNRQGDTTRARFEWRMAYRLNPAHAGARARLN
ncbi:MAG: tetratricopeptide repeat protein [Treponema sp.]|jgi:tetratricopeptide (TPR) repeat protein|nr:tetratricopeptide repeat protein [Treponema sp.]